VLLFKFNKEKEPEVVMETPQNTSHIVFGIHDNLLECSHCGKVFLPKIPAKIDDFVAECNKFVAQHENCKPLMKLREHRGNLAESMATVIEIPPTLEALKTVINNELSVFGVPEITDNMIRIEPYGFDKRINWNTHIVMIAGYGVYGYIDGPLQETSC